MSVMLWYTNQNALQGGETDSKKKGRIEYLAGINEEKKNQTVSFQSGSKDNLFYIKACCVGVYTLKIDSVSSVCSWLCWVLFCDFVQMEKKKKKQTCSKIWFDLICGRRRGPLDLNTAIRTFQLLPISQ